MTSSFSKTHHRKALAGIAGGCCALLLVAYLLPFLMNALGGPIPEFPDELTGWPRARNWVREHLTPRWLWVYHRAEGSLTNAVQAYGKRASLHPDIVFLAIDSASFEQSELTEEERQDPALQMMAGGFPFPRSIYPLIIQRLAEAGAKVVMLDILVPDPREYDEAFAAALFQYREHIVLGSNLQINEALNESGRDSPIPPSETLIPGGDRLYDDRVGYVNFIPDFDNTVRKVHYRTTLQEYFGSGYDEDSRELLSLSAQGAAKAGLTGRIPATHDPVLFRYVDDPRPRSLHDIFVPDLWRKNFADGKFFKGKLVFIGPYGNWSKDELQTPFGPKLGPEIHISALNSILTQDFLRQTSPLMDLCLILLGGAMAVFVGLRVTEPLQRIGALLLLLVLFIGAAYALFFTEGLLISLLGPSVALLSSGFVGLGYERKLERAEKQRVRTTLERYVSKDVVKEVLDNPLSYLHTAGGMRRPVSILFSDIRGFTTMTESADPAKLVEQLNEYFTEMVRIVFANRGTLDKFIGDAVMAHWGALVSRGEGPDACRAVATALDMLKAMPRLNARWKERGLQELAIGVAVNHGEAICANIGSFEKHEFTAIGDTVNLASRLEGATKQFRQDLLIGEGVAPLVAHQYWLRPVDLLQVKGKTKPVAVFAVLGDRKLMPVPGWLAAYEEGMQLFRQRSFFEAFACFNTALAEIPGDWLCEEYQRRCREYEVNPPAAEWDGVYVMERK